MHILHTEASKGWGGQEIRILRESIGMRERGHRLFFAVSPGAELGYKAKENGFDVIEVPFKWKTLPYTLFKLIRWIQKNHITLVNTHSSLDAWLGGIAARLAGASLVRTRHLSTPSKPGLNSRLLYHYLADTTVTTCEAVAEQIKKQAALPRERCLSIPTGVDFIFSPAPNFRRDLNISSTDFVVGTVCILRSWKGISDLLQAAFLLRDEPSLKWVIVGSGPSEERYKNECKELGLTNVLFTGFMKDVSPAILAFDLFTLLSTAHEGVSQASLQAAYLKKPLLTTSIGGLPEVCIEGKTGLIVPPHSPKAIAEKILFLKQNPSLCKSYGETAHTLAKETFSFQKTLDQMERVYNKHH